MYSRCQVPYLSLHTPMHVKPSLARSFSRAAALSLCHTCGCIAPKVTPAHFHIVRRNCGPPGHAPHAGPRARSLGAPAVGRLPGRPSGGSRIAALGRRSGVARGAPLRTPPNCGPNPGTAREAARSQARGRRCPRLQVRPAPQRGPATRRSPAAAHYSGQGGPTPDPRLWDKSRGARAPAVPWPRAAARHVGQGRPLGGVLPGAGGAARCSPLTGASLIDVICCDDRDDPVACDFPLAAGDHMACMARTDRSHGLRRPHGMRRPGGLRRSRWAAAAAATAWPAATPCHAPIQWQPPIRRRASNAPMACGGRMACAGPRRSHWPAANMASGHPMACACSEASGGVRPPSPWPVATTWHAPPAMIPEACGDPP